MAGAHPYSLLGQKINPLARMLPIGFRQEQVYRLAERVPPSGDLWNHGPMWEPVTCTLAALTTTQLRVNLQRDFTLISICTTVSTNTVGGFRAQLYDIKKRVRLMDRGIQQALIGGNQTPAPPFSGPFRLREPYKFDAPDSQVLVIVQNLESVTNTIQMALYGVVLRFNEPGVAVANFPGGAFASSSGGVQ